MTATSHFWRGVACALGGATLWGFSGACIQFLGENYAITSSFISFVRAAVAAVLFIAVVLATRREALLSLLDARAARGPLLLFGVGLYLSQITYAISIEYTNAGTATVLQATCTVFVMLFTCLKLRRAPRVPDLIGLVCALAAATLIATQGDWGVIVLPMAGLAWGIVNALSETLYIMAPQRLYGRWDRVTIISCGMVISGIAAALVWAAQAVGSGAGLSSLVPALDAVGWLALLGGVGLLGTFAAFGLFLYGVSLVGSVKGSLLGVAEPAGAMVIAALWLGTAFSGADWAALILMAAMIALVSLSGAKGERASGATAPPAS